MPQGPTLFKFSGHAQLGGDHGADPELTEGIIISHLVQKFHGTPQEEHETIAEEEDIWKTLHSLLSS